MLHLDWNIIWTVVNLLILFVFLKKFLFSKVLDIIAKRQSMVDSSFSEAKKASEEAAGLKLQYENNLKNADEQAADIISSAKERANEIHDKAVSDTRKETEKMIEEANRVIALEQEKAMQASKQEITCLAVAIASKIISNKSDNNNNSHELDAFLAEAGAKR